MSMQTISIMDYIGTFAFALSGAYLAIRYELDIFGIFVCILHCLRRRYYP